MTVQALPRWLDDLARQYHAGRTAVFLLHGNIHDLVWYENRPYPLREFLAQVVFRRREVVLLYNRGTGLTFRDEKSRSDMEAYLRQVGERFESLRFTAELFPLLHRYFHHRLSEGHRMALILEYGEMLVPNSGTYLANEERTALLYLLQWAQSPLFLRSDITILLLAESLSEVHPKLTANPHVSSISIPYPNAEVRRLFLEYLWQNKPDLSEKIKGGISLEALTIALGGLTLVQIEKLIAEIAQSTTPWEEAQILERKKVLVEAQAGGLLEFMSTHLTLEAVAGHRAAKAYLRSIAQAIKNGHTSSIPMGFLITGPVGTGKTFLLRCFAGEIGIPMVQLKNFRSKWVGETEANLERILALLEALAPIAVVIDEADTQLGQRASEGDSGLNARIFGRLASFMSDTRHRGRILWFLITARPDLLPIDLKRQGRAEEHIPLFPPTTAEEKREVVTALARRLGMPNLEFPTSDAFWEELPTFSGAEWEAILTRARFQATLAGSSEPTWADVMQALNDFLPPSYPEEVAYMNYLAILECTRRSLLPPAYQNFSREELFQRLEGLRARLQ
ncbi:MAG: AAA family ATPase [Bacteroidia bacterium]|nr:AAA family ATPase [Bacteroidia bacterium]MDW8089581.1 AAA family ATPase [Bacteroidia bacterium]